MDNARPMPVAPPVTIATRCTRAAYPSAGSPSGPTSARAAARLALALRPRNDDDPDGALMGDRLRRVGRTGRDRLELAALVEIVRNDDRGRAVVARPADHRVRTRVRRQPGGRRHPGPSRVTNLSSDGGAAGGLECLLVQFARDLRVGSLSRPLAREGVAEHGRRVPVVQDQPTATTRSDAHGLDPRRAEPIVITGHGDDGAPVLPRTRVHARSLDPGGLRSDSPGPPRGDGGMPSRTRPPAGTRG